MNVVDRPIEKDVKLKLRDKTALMTRLLHGTGIPISMYTICDRSSTKPKGRAIIKRFILKNCLAQSRMLIAIHLMSKDSTIRLASSSLRPAFEMLLSPAICLRSS